MATGAVPLLRLGLLSQRYWCWIRRRGGSMWPPAYPIPKEFLKNRRGGAEGESAEGREKPPWGVPLPRAGLGPAPIWDRPLRRGRTVIALRRARPPGRAAPAACNARRGGTPGPPAFYPVLPRPRKSMEKYRIKRPPASASNIKKGAAWRRLFMVLGKLLGKVGGDHLVQSSCTGPPPLPSHRGHPQSA